MSKKWITILLFVSLAFNLAVLGSLFWLRNFRPCPAPNMGPPMPPHSGFGKYQHLRPTPEIKALFESFDNTKIALMSELAKDTIDETKVVAIIDSSLTAQKALERALGYRLLNLRKEMSAEEAKTFFGERIQNMKNRKEKMNKFHNRRKHHEKNADN